MIFFILIYLLRLSECPGADLNKILLHESKDFKTLVRISIVISVNVIIKVIYFIVIISIIVSKYYSVTLVSSTSLATIASIGLIFSSSFKAK